MEVEEVLPWSNDRLCPCLPPFALREKRSTCARLLWRRFDSYGIEIPVFISSPPPQELWAAAKHSDSEASALKIPRRGKNHDRWRWA